jgi:CheY-like chemotaxis protein
MNNKYKILIVEDNKLNQKILSFWLSKGHFVFKVSETGEDAIEIFKQEWFDVVIMDIMLSGINGFETTRQIRIEGNKVYKKQPFIIALTANTLDNDKNRCLKNGMDDYLAKPFDMKKLDYILESLYLPED